MAGRLTAKNPLPGRKSVCRNRPHTGGGLLFRSGVRETSGGSEHSPHGSPPEDGQVMKMAETSLQNTAVFPQKPVRR
jgi:hypothetical protein